MPWIKSIIHVITRYKHILKKIIVSLNELMSTSCKVKENKNNMTRNTSYRLYALKVKQDSIPKEKLR